MEVPTTLIEQQMKIILLILQRDQAEELMKKEKYCFASQ